MATSAVQDHIVSSSTSDEPFYFAQNEDETEVYAESDLENRQREKKEVKLSAITQKKHSIQKSKLTRLF